MKPLIIQDATMQRVIECRELSWNFDNQPPAVIIDTGRWVHQERVDPCEGYAHDTLRVALQLAKCEELFPLPQQPNIYLLKHETLGRTNGWTSHDHDYNKNDKHGRSIGHPYIVLSGKRIPLHPAMTRYLVAHEYGHAVDTYLAHLRYSGKHPEQEQDEEYIKLRGLTPQKSYGPGTWHKSVGEVFANDFRIFVCGVEPEFWPHEVPPPHEVAAVADWWKARLYEVAEARRQELEPKLAV